MNLIERLRRDAVCMTAWANGIGPYPATVAGVSAKHSEHVTQAADALEALKGYAVHDEGCGTQMYLSPRRCDCGLSDLLAKLGGE